MMNNDEDDKHQWRLNHLNVKEQIASLFPLQGVVRGENPHDYLENMRLVHAMRETLPDVLKLSKLKSGEVLACFREVGNLSDFSWNYNMGHDVSLH
jgi:hypothetical protein